MVGQSRLAELIWLPCDTWNYPRYRANFVLLGSRSVTRVSHVFERGSERSTVSRIGLRFEALDLPTPANPLSRPATIPGGTLISLAFRQWMSTKVWRASHQIWRDAGRWRVGAAVSWPFVA